MTTATTPTKAATPAGTSPRERARLWGLMIEFETPGAILQAARKVRDAGYKWWDCCSPFPVHGLDDAMGIKPTFLPVLVFFGGLTGTMLATFLQWFTNAESFDLWALVSVRGYDFNISGKPYASVPAWVPVMFEVTVLLSALGAIGWMLLLNWLPRWYHPCFKSDRFARVTDDRFFLYIEARDPKFYREETETFLESLDPLGDVEALED